MEEWWPRFSILRCIIWVCIIPVAYFLGWLGVVTFVAVCSLYANAASDFAAWRADRDERIDRIEERVNEIIRRLDEMQRQMSQGSGGSELSRSR